MNRGPAATEASTTFPKRDDGYPFACTLETHWRGAGTPEASSRESFAGMKALLQKAGALS